MGPFCFFLTDLKGKNIDEYDSKRKKQMWGNTKICQNVFAIILFFFYFRLFTQVMHLYGKHIFGVWYCCLTSPDPVMASFQSGNSKSFLMKCFMQYPAGFFKQHHILPILFDTLTSRYTSRFNTLWPTCSARWLWDLACSSYSLAFIHLTSVPKGNNWH